MGALFQVLHFNLESRGFDQDHKPFYQCLLQCMLCQPKNQFMQFPWQQLSGLAHSQL